MGRTATLDAGAWWIEGTGARDRQAPITKLHELAAVMLAAGIDVLHVHASALPTLGLPLELAPPLPGQRRPPHTFMAAGELRASSSALAPWVELEHPDGAKLAIGFGAYIGSGDPFGDAADARELLAAHLEYAAALAEKGRPWRWEHSAILTGWRLMHAPWERGGRRRRRPLDAAGPELGELALELDGHPAGTQVEVPYGGAWAHKPRPRSRRLPWVAAWDVNGQRLAACSRLALGVDGLEHRPGGDAELKLPGYHRVTSVLEPHRGQVPAIFAPGWHTTPRVAMARYLELEPQVSESWVWTDHLPYLDPFYDRMRAARAQLLEGGPDRAASAIALNALKQTYLQPFGRLRSTKLRERRDVRYRPSWYDAIIGQELAREYLRLHQLAAAGERVLAVYFDTIICEVPEPGYVPAALELSDQLGKYKAAGELPTADAYAALYLEDRSTDVGALVKALKAGAGDHPLAPLAGALPPAPALSTFTRPVHGGYPEPAA